ncbi:MAG TPA: hypothetical protein VFJ27_00450, partial [Terriglobia bacterium]|nr:hypothetical protein [Terriglobia bacterium]
RGFSTCWAVVAREPRGVHWFIRAKAGIQPRFGLAPSLAGKTTILLTLSLDPATRFQDTL